MNAQYKHIYLSDKSEQDVCKLPTEDLNDATEGLKMIKDDDVITVWDGQEYQIIGIKA